MRFGMLVPMNNGQPPGGQMHGYYQHGVSLLTGWLPWTVQIVAVLLLVAAIGWRSRRWRLVYLPVAAGIGALGALVVKWYFDDSGLATDPAPISLWLWIGVFVATPAIFALGWRSARWWRRGVSALTIPVSVVCVGLVLNQWVGYFPTVSQFWGTITSGPLPGQISETDLAGLRGKGPTMTTGRIVEVDTPDTASHFTHRQEYVYLPPTWFNGPQPPALPAIMMIAGEFNTAADWVRTGNALTTIDDYQHAHGGYAPILVFVDAGGAFNNDTECVNGPRGNAADHLTADVRPYVTSHFGVPTDPKQWGVVGWSMGGSCAVDLTAMHPELFDNFVDIAGDLGPTVGDKQQTVDRLYGGNTAAWAHFDPMTVLAHHGPYADTAGWFANSNGVGAFRPGGNHRPGGGGPGGGGPGGGGQGGGRRGGGGGMNYQDQMAEARELSAAMAKVGILTTLHTYSGGHTWQFASRAFTESLPWMDARLRGLPQPNLPQPNQPQPQPSQNGGVPAARPTGGTPPAVQAAPRSG